MSFQDNPTTIRWSLHLKSAPEEVFQMLATDHGRAQFWAESAIEQNNHIHFIFPGGQSWQGEILARVPPQLFRVVYFGGSIATFSLKQDGQGGTDLVLTDEGVAEEHRCEVISGWVSVLMALKAAVDFGVDLRNHDPQRTWDTGYVDN